MISLSSDKVFLGTLPPRPGHPFHAALIQRAAGGGFPASLLPVNFRGVGRGVAEIRLVQTVFLDCDCVSRATEIAFPEPLRGCFVAP